MRSSVIIMFLCVATLLNAVPHSQDAARALYEHTDYDGAISLLANAPKTAHSLELLGQSHYMQSDFKRASDALEKAAALAPDDSMIQMWLGRAWGRRAERAFALAAIGLANKTREAFERAVRLDAHNCEAVNDLFAYYLQAPGIVGGGIEKANALLPLIEACDPSERQFANARMQEHRKQFNEAEASLRRAIELAPRQPGRYLDLAKFFARRGRYEESEQAFQSAQKIAPSAPRILFVRAEVYIDTKRNPDQARALLKQYLESSSLTPEDPSRADALRLLKKLEGK